MKHSFSTLTGRLLAVLALFALSLGIANGATDNPAQQVVRTTTEQVLAVLRKEGGDIKGDSQRLYKVIDELILPHFNFKKMSRWVLGRHWRKASAEQQQAFMLQFQGLLVRTYAQALIDYRNQQIDFLPVSPDAAETVVVRTRVNQEGGPGIPIVYKMSMQDGDWKVFDVSIDGVSLVVNYRASFNDEIRRNGLDGLIKRLSAHNSKNT